MWNPNAESAAQFAAQHEIPQHYSDINALLQQQDFHGLCFVNLVDFDSAYGHRNDIDGYANALREFDAWLPQFLQAMY